MVLLDEVDIHQHIVSFFDMQVRADIFLYRQEIGAWLLVGEDACRSRRGSYSYFHFDRSSTFSGLRWSKCFDLIADCFGDGYEKPRCFVVLGSFPYGIGEREMCMSHRWMIEKANACCKRSFVSNAIEWSNLLAFIALFRYDIWS